MRAKSEERTKARMLRKQGWAITKIATELHVAKSSVSAWVSDIPQPEEFRPSRRKERKLKRKQALVKAKKANHSLKKRVISGGRWLIQAPPGYEGPKYIGGRYVSQSRFLMEQRLGRVLAPDEVVHHKNGDPLDDCIENLELCSRSKHSREHTKARGRSMVHLRCPTCGSEFHRRRLHTHLVKSSALSFCSLSCSSTYYTKRKTPTKEDMIANVIAEYKLFPNNT